MSSKRERADEIEHQREKWGKRKVSGFDLMYKQMEKDLFMGHYVISNNYAYVLLKHRYLSHLRLSFEEAQSCDKEMDIHYKIIFDELNSDTDNRLKRLTVWGNTLAFAHMYRKALKMDWASKDIESKWVQKRHTRFTSALKASRDNSTNIDREFVNFMLETLSTPIQSEAESDALEDVLLKHIPIFVSFSTICAVQAEVWMTFIKDYMLSAEHTSNVERWRGRYDFLKDLLSKMNFEYTFARFVNVLPEMKLTGI